MPSHIFRALHPLRPVFAVQGNESMAHSDQPLKDGNVHISAPHIYASAMEALDLVPNSSMSFLNIGSGTGYISCIVAGILGANSLNYGILFVHINYLPWLSHSLIFSTSTLLSLSLGVELHGDVIEHCKSSIAKWKTNAVEESGHVSTFHFMDSTPKIHIVKGNGLNIDTEKGESVAGFDRIYVGASVDKDAFRNIVQLLSPGGILVGPGEWYLMIFLFNIIFAQSHSYNIHLSFIVLCYSWRRTRQGRSCRQYFFPNRRRHSSIKDRRRVHLASLIRSTLRSSCPPPVRPNRTPFSCLGSIGSAILSEWASTGKHGDYDVLEFTSDAASASSAETGREDQCCSHAAKICLGGDTLLYSQKV